MIITRDDEVIYIENNKDKITLKENLILDLQQEFDRLCERELTEEEMDDSYNYIIDDLETRFTTEYDRTLSLQELVKLVNILDDLTCSWTESLGLALDYLKGELDNGI